MKNKKQTNKKKFLKLDLGCGQRKHKGYIGVDITKENTQADVKHDLFTFPWPFESNSVDEILADHFLEHIPHGNDNKKDLLFSFMDEAWRILKPSGIFNIKTPYYTSIRAFQDPTHHRVITENTYGYFDKSFRKFQKLDHYNIVCDFEIVSINHGVNSALASRSQDALQYAVAHDWNVVEDLVVSLKKRI